MITLTELKKKDFKYRMANAKFRHFLKCNADSDDLDKRFLRLHKEIMSNYDCSKCRNCCLEYGGLFTKEEAINAAAAFNLTFEAFLKKYLKKEVGEKDKYCSKTIPCIFLDKNGDCIAKDNKPLNCKEYPYTGKPNRLASMLSMIEIANFCPVAYEILERLKEEYDFKSNDYLFDDDVCDYDEFAPVKEKFPEFKNVDMNEQRKLAEKGDVRAMFIYGYYIVCQFDASEIDDYELYQEGILYIKQAAEAGDEDAKYWCDDFYSDDGGFDTFD